MCLCVQYTVYRIFPIRIQNQRKFMFTSSFCVTSISFFFSVLLLYYILRLFSVWSSNQKNTFTATSTTICVYTTYEGEWNKPKTGNSTSNNNNKPLLQEPIHIYSVANCISATIEVFFVHSWLHASGTNLAAHSAVYNIWLLVAHMRAHTNNHSQSTSLLACIERQVQTDR